MPYTAQQASALRTILRKGVQTTLSRIVPAAIDEMRDVATGGGPQSQAIVAVVLPASESRDMTPDAKSDVRQNRRRVMIAGLAPDGSALAWDPSTEKRQQTLVAEGATWIVDALSRLAPDGGAAIYFDGEVRR
jgi:hypothetical protein